MWAIMRATSIASWVRIAWRATFENAMFCARQARRRAHQHGALDLVGMVERPLQDLHAAERAADRARAAASMPSARSSARCTATMSRIVNSGKSSP